MSYFQQDINVSKKGIIKAFFEVHSGPLFELNRARQILWFNEPGRDYVERIWGSAPAVGDSMDELSSPELLEAFRRRTDQVFASGQSQRIERELSYPGGVTIRYEVSCVPVRGEDDQVESVLFVVRDVTREHQLGQERRIYARALEELEYGVTIADARVEDLPLVYVNDAFLRITGYERGEVLGRNCRFLQGQDRDQPARAQMREAFAREQATVVRVRNYRKDGTPFINRVSLSPMRDEAGELTHFIGIQDEITDRIAMERSLRHAQRMEDLGQLAAGVAHDVNNTLHVILQAEEFIGENLRRGEIEEALEDLDMLGEAAERACEMVDRLMTFARRKPVRMEVLDLRQVFERAANMIRLLVGRDIELILERPEEELMALASDVELEQLLINLAANARDAIQGGQGSTLRVGLASLSTERTRQVLISPFHRPATTYANFWVEDDGVGIEPEHLERLFDPFFTTKPEGQGTGLGLAMCFGIARHHDGWIDVESTPGRGSRFSVLIPLIEGDTEPVAGERWSLELEEPGALRGPEGGLASSHGARSLLITSDEQLRARLVLFLEGAGFEVSFASEIEELSRGSEPIELLLLDQESFEEDVSTSLAQLRRHSPQLRVIFLIRDGEAAQPPELSGYIPALLVSRALAPELVARAVERFIRQIPDFESSR